MSTNYQKDAARWAEEQGALLRSGRLSEVDLENVAEEIAAFTSEPVAKKRVPYKKSAQAEAVEAA